MLHMPLPAMLFSENEAKALDLHFLWLDTADLLTMALSFGQGWAVETTPGFNQRF